LNSCAADMPLLLNVHCKLLSQ